MLNAQNIYLKYQKVEVQDLWGGSARKRVTKLGSREWYFTFYDLLNGQQGVTLHKQWNKSNKEWHKMVYQTYTRSSAVFWVTSKQK